MPDLRTAGKGEAPPWIAQNILHFLVIEKSPPY